LLDSSKRNIERVAIRVKKGGHSVPEDKIIERHAKSLNQLPWFLEQADNALLFDNSGAKPMLIGEKQNGQIILDPNANSDFKDAVKKIET
jgi:predicted ABC-type ATPase